MADPVARLSCGDEHFDLSGLMSDEMAHVKSWTGLKNRPEFYQALQDEDPDAITAAFTLASRRNGQPDRRFSDVKVNLDDLKWSRHIDGRTVRVLAERDENDEPLIVLVDDRGEPLRDAKGAYRMPTGEVGEKVGAVLIKGPKGELRWQYVDTGEDADPTTEPETSGLTGSPTTAKKRRSTGSDSGTETTSNS